MKISTIREFRLPEAPVGFLVIETTGYYAAWQIHEPDVIRVREPGGTDIDRLTLQIGGCANVADSEAGAGIPAPVKLATELALIENWGGTDSQVEEYCLTFRDDPGTCEHRIRFFEDRIEYRLRHSPGQAKQRLQSIVIGAGPNDCGCTFNARQLFNPGPMSHGLYHHAPSRPQQIRPDWLTPPPFAYCFEAPDSTWTTAALEDAPGNMPYTHFMTQPRANNQTAFEIRYASLPVAGRQVESPCLTFRFGAESEEAALRQHAAGMVSAGRIPAMTRQPAPWWRGVMVCGWHQQIHRGNQNGSGNAEAACCQEVYEQWVAELEAAKIDFDILTVDMFWGRQHGVWQVDTERWPDVRGFIDRQHAKGRHVLLWIGVNIFGLPDDELYIVGNRKLIDPLNPQWRKRLAAACDCMFGDGPNDLNADGVKFDFTDVLPPAGNPARCTRELHGLDYLYELFMAVREAAKAVRDDVLLDFQVAHPAFAPLYDMTRINDFFLSQEQAVRAMGWRARIAEAVGFGALVDTDGPVGDEYFRHSHRFGNPSFYVDSRHIADTSLSAAMRKSCHDFKQYQNEKKQQ